MFYADYAIREQDVPRLSRHPSLKHSRGNSSIVHEQTDFILTSENVYIISPHSTFKKRWEIVGFIILLTQLFLHFNAVEMLFGYIPITDLYFLCDCFVRFRTGYIDTRTGEIVMDPKLIQKTYTTTWFMVDVLLSIPYHLLWIMWNNSATLEFEKTLRVSSSGSKRIIDFVRNGNYRQKLVKSFKEYIVESRSIKNGIFGSVKPNKLRQFVLSLTKVFRASKSFRKLNVMKRTMHFLNNFVMSCRTIITFHRTMENTSDKDAD